jgi:hypothetical protein
MRVKNIIGSSNSLPPAGYSSWLDFWKAHYHGNQPLRCAAYSHGSEHTDLVGAHVKKVDSSDNSWYIVPLCKALNASTEEFYVNDDMMVPENQD